MTMNPMKKTVLTILATSGVALGGLSVASAASAQGYGDTDPADADSVTTEEVVDDIDTDGSIIVVQDEVEEAPADGDGEAHEGRGHHRGGCNLEAAAEAIGIDVDELRTALDEGQSIANVATANGVEPDAVVDAMVAERAERLAAAVESGRLTQEEADERLADKSEKIEDRVFDTVEEEAVAA